MSVIAKGFITLNSVNDAFSVSLSPSSCVINADYDGQNPKLNYAYCDIRVVRGDTLVAFERPVIISQSNNATVEITPISNTVWRIKLTSIPPSDLSGNLNIQIQAAEEFLTTVVFSYTVVRESSMLDWILDWEGRSKTEIAGSHVITPKLFVGMSENDGQLTGTYIGPAFDSSGRTGVFGYSKGREIFHLDNTGGMLGGWEIQDGGIQTSDSTLKILSDGSIISAPNGIMAWELKKDGSASFASGKVKMLANGNAEFEGKITTESGKIGGWIIGQHSIRNYAMMIDALDRFIGIRNAQISGDSLGEPSVDSFKADMRRYGGLCMYYNNSTDYGLTCYNQIFSSINGGNIDGVFTPQISFSLGSNNIIAGWNFDTSAIWLGIKNNTSKQNTANEGDITIGTSGLRGKNWYIDTDGEISFVGGLLRFTKDGSVVAGWSMAPNRFSTDCAALVSQSGYAGLYLSTSSLPDSIMDYDSHILNNGGIWLKAAPSGPTLRGQNKYGNMIFQLSSGVSYIGGWQFSDKCLFTGAFSAPAGEFAPEGNITLAPDGLRGYKFRLEADGSGSIAGDNISWESDGTIHFASSVSLNWKNISEALGDNFTKINGDTIYTGTINADNITSGKLKADRIDTDELLSVQDKWGLNRDGSGYLASKNIEWSQSGDLSIKGNVSVRTMRYILSTEIGNGQVVQDAFVAALLGGDCVLTLPHLDSNEYRVIKVLGALTTRTGGQIVLNVENESDSIIWGTDVVRATQHKTYNLGEQFGYFELVGRGSEMSTMWHIIPLYIANS